MRSALLTLFIIITTSFTVLAEGGALWREIQANEVNTEGKQQLFPSIFKIYQTDPNSLQYQLRSIPDNADSKRTIVLPMPDGKMRTFIVWQAHIMDVAMELKYPMIKTYTAYAIDDPRVTAKIDQTVRGFHAMIFESGNISFIDPYSDVNDGYYICYYKKDYKRADSELMACAVNDDARVNKLQMPDVNTSNLRVVNGNVLRKFRLALACTGEYAQAVGGTIPTKASVLSAMVTTLNRVNGVYERELAITMQLVSNEDTLIFLTAGAYSNNNVFALIAQNQDTTDRRIGNLNYDLGHVFSTGGGGYSQIGCTCYPTKKAQSETGSMSPVGDAYDIDYVAHEIGHEFGADHSFNDNTNGFCAGNAAFEQAYEPGSGSTIMCYAGICDGDNIQAHSDAYFHAVSLKVINDFITIPYITTCAQVSNSGNKPVGIPAFAQDYNIPYLTPFEITAPLAIDSVADTLTTYCWEEWDRGSFGQTFDNTSATGPIFRSFVPDTSRTRVFPKLSSIVNNNLNYLGEKVPEVARKLTFKLTVRDIYNGIGCIHIPDDSILLNVINTGAAFKVTEPDAAITWKAKSTSLVTWDVAQTNTAPINCDSVLIYLSVDGGYTYPYFLGKTLNNGSATVQVPDAVTTAGRIKVKSVNNVFFDISNTNFTIDSVAVSVNDLVLYPVPTGKATGYVLYGRIGNIDPYDFMVCNAIGQMVLNGQATRSLTLNLSGLSPGVYYIKLRNQITNTSIVKPFVVR